MTTEDKEAGKIKIDNDIVAMFAGQAALDTDGVAGMSGGLTEDFTKLISGKNTTKGVQVEVDETDATINLKVVIKAEYKLHEVSKDLQLNVKEKVESMTGLHVVKVNVFVEGVEIKKKEKEEKEEVQEEIVELEEVEGLLKEEKIIGNESVINEE